MENNEFKSIMELLVPSLVKCIIKENGASEKDAITLLYTSFLYSKLENEKTKLWHLSSKTLIDMLNEEMATGNITYPEEA